jgi:hypothetical protein
MPSVALLGEQGVSSAMGDDMVCNQRGGMTGHTIEGGGCHQ